MFIQIVGWGGTLAILLAYFLVSAKKLAASSKVFQLLNLFGALGIIINSWYFKAIPSVALNVVWLSIATYSLFRIGKNKTKV